jgi:hypothetical protein
VHGEEDEFLGILDGEKAEEDLIEESENGGVSADAKGESEDGNYSEAGVRARVRRAYLKSRKAVSSEAIVFISRTLSFGGAWMTTVNTLLGGNCSR